MLLRSTTKQTNKQTVVHLQMVTYRLFKTVGWWGGAGGAAKHLLEDPRKIYTRVLP